MPFKCIVGGCPHQSSKQKTLKYHSFPKDEKSRRKWISAVKLRTKFYKWKSSHRICSAHFHGGIRYGANNIPAIFPRIDPKTHEIVWPVDISHLLKEETSEEKENVSRSNVTVPAVECCQDMRTGVTSNPAFRSEPTSPRLQRPNITDDLENERLKHQNQIERLLERIREQERSREAERFGINRFMSSDSDIKFFSGLPDYQTFIALYEFMKPRPGYFLNYYNKHSNACRDPTYVVPRGRPRARKLCEIDELFLTLTRLRLGLLEKDLADRFHISQRDVSETFATWVDHLHDCLAQLSCIPDRETMVKNLPKCFKPHYEDVFLIIDCTEPYIEKPSQVIQKSATWSEYKGHNTGKALIALSLLLLPVFASDVCPGCKSDEEILCDCGILSLAKAGDRWLADKGFIVQHILDDNGVRMETPVKLKGKKQFSVEEDILNRKNSQVRVHVERAIRRVNVFRILRGKIPLRYTHLLSKIWKVCCWITAFLLPLIKEDGELVDDKEK